MWFNQWKRLVAQIFFYATGFILKMNLRTSEMSYVLSEELNFNFYFKSIAKSKLFSKFCKQGGY